MKHQPAGFFLTAFFDRPKKAVNNNLKNNYA
jgi:hypothetical protein